MEMTLVGVVIGAIIILILVRGVGFFFARNAARNAYRNGMNQQVTGRVTLHRIVTEGPSILVVGLD
jgi:heme/copper-type cytochrome/quinol oxidase subunit 2